MKCLEEPYILLFLIEDSEADLQASEQSSPYTFVNTLLEKY